ncbi:MAG: hypothetical protein ACJAW1_003567 [Glaciecola sp.]|jgi:hypothetical protein
MPNAPIILFVFNRPEHTKNTLEALTRNVEFSESPFFVFCDGPRNDKELGDVEATRLIVRDWPHPQKIIVERDSNYGLAKSIITGVTELCEKFGKVIVLEDDLIVSPIFLNYMNTALNLYEKEDKVMQISGHMFPVNVASSDDAVMLPFTTSWGWATWDRAWQHFDPDMLDMAKLKADVDLKNKFNCDGGFPGFKMLKKQQQGEINSWAIRWYLSVFIKNGLILFPKQTLVINDGFDGSGTNCYNSNKLVEEYLRTEKIEEYPAVAFNENAFKVVKKFLRKEQAILRKLFKYGGGIWSRLIG